MRTKPTSPSRSTQPSAWVLSARDWRRALHLYLDGRITRAQFERMKERLTRLRGASVGGDPRRSPPLKVVAGGHRRAACEASAEPPHVGGRLITSLTDHRGPLSPRRRNSILALVPPCSRDVGLTVAQYGLVVPGNELGLPRLRETHALPTGAEQPSRSP